MERVVADGVEQGVGEADDDAEDGCGDVFDHGAPVDGDAPVFARGDGDVEIAGKLVALLRWLLVPDDGERGGILEDVVEWKRKERRKRKVEWRLLLTE